METPAGCRLLQRIEEAAATAVAGGEYWRPTYTPQDAAVVKLLQGYLQQGGMTVEHDAVGNLFGILPGSSDEVIMVGSHRDTVRHGGKYDGILGVLTAIEAADLLYRELGAPKKTVKVVAICEEENSRFPTRYLGSRNLCGEFEACELEDRDARGISLGEAMKQAGYLQKPLGGKLPQRFVELHIEQGGVLEHEGLQIGIVTDIVGLFTGEIIFGGHQNHAGTTPMALRRDPMPVACDFVCRLMAWARRYSSDTVCTVGRIIATPGNMNVIPHSVRVSFDIRSARPERLEEAARALAALRDTVAAEQQGSITVELDIQCNEPPVALDPAGAALLEQAVQACGCTYRTMVSGAGHDSQVMARHCPANMLFIPSVGGVSHSTAEYSLPEDIAAGAAVLKEYLRRLAW